MNESKRVAPLPDPDKHRVTKPLDAASRARLFALVQDRNELAVMKEIGISRTAMMRALAGLPIYAGTRIAIGVLLASLESEQDAAT